MEIKLWELIFCSSRSRSINLRTQAGCHWWVQTLFTAKWLQCYLPSAVCGPGTTDITKPFTVLPQCSLSANGKDMKSKLVYLLFNLIHNWQKDSSFIIYLTLHFILNLSPDVVSCSYKFSLTMRWYSLVLTLLTKLFTP